MRQTHCACGNAVIADLNIAGAEAVATELGNPHTLGGHNIRANAVAPGPMDTPMLRSGIPVGSDTERLHISPIRTKWRARQCISPATTRASSLVKLCMSMAGAPGWRL